MERIVTSKMRTFLAESGSLIPLQHGFRPRHSCLTQLLETIHQCLTQLLETIHQCLTQLLETIHQCLTQLLETIHQWAAALDKGKSIHAVFLDFAKAFDSVPLQRLLIKLDHIGVRGQGLK